MIDGVKFHLIRLVELSMVDGLVRHTNTFPRENFPII